jgi:prephenate dehydratase
VTTIGFLGPAGTFTEVAVDQCFPKVARYSYRTIPQCIEAVKCGEVDFGIVPLENTIEGSVNLTIDYIIHEQKIPIVGEITLPIRQHLMVHPVNEKKWAQTETIVSHSHAIAQCHQFIRNDIPKAEIQYVNSTGAAAEYVQSHPNESVASIGNELAAEEYNLKIVKHNVHDYDNNHTRFVILHRNAKPIQSMDSEIAGYKTTLLITLPSDYAGALHQVLSAFAWRKLNLSKIESRPMKTGLGNYFFIIDVNMELDSVLLPSTKAELEALGCNVHILGSYPCFEPTSQYVYQRKD